MPFKLIDLSAISDETATRLEVSKIGVSLSDSDLMMIRTALTDKANEHYSAHSRCFKADGSAKPPDGIVADYAAIAQNFADREHDYRRLLAEIEGVEPPERVIVTKAPAAEVKQRKPSKHKKKWQGEPKNKISAI